LVKPRLSKRCGNLPGNPAKSVRSNILFDRQVRSLTVRKIVFTKKHLQVILTALIVTVGLSYLYVNRAHLSVLRSIQVKDLALVSFLVWAFFFATGYTFKMLVSILGVKLSLTETLGLSIITNFGNYLGPIRPGAALKAMYLKSAKGLAYAKFTSVLAANLFLAFLMTGTLGAVLLIFLKKKTSHVPIFLLLVCLGLVLGSMLPFVYRIPNVKGDHTIKIVLQSALEGFRTIRSQKLKLFMICLTFLAQFVLAALGCVVAFGSLGAPITLLEGLVIGVFTSVANLFTITPNNLGVQEAVIAYLFTVTGFDFTTGVIGAGLLRVIHMIITFGLTPIFAHRLLGSTGLRLPGD